jgi:hypothetical protein
MRAKRFLAALPALACVLVFDGAETVAQQEKKVRREVTTGAASVQQDVIVMRPQGEGSHAQTFVRGQGSGDNTFVFVSSEMTIDGKVVKGAPYSAESVTETTQSFADGNRITRKNTAQVYRDSEGRTRREQALGMIGPFAPHGGDPVQNVFIHDPVSGNNYILDARTKTARKVLARVTFERELKRDAERVQAEARAQGGGGGGEVKVREQVRDLAIHAPLPHPPGGGPEVIYFSHGGEKPKVEELGTDTVEGVKAEGRRITHTIPAGAIGNEREINIVTERWYSPELQTVVRTSHSDPRFGTTVYRLSNINRTEPAASLFQVPSDYAVKEGPAAGFGGGRTFRMKKPEQKENFFFEFNAKPEQQ